MLVIFHEENSGLFAFMHLNGQFISLIIHSLFIHRTIRLVCSDKLIH